MRKQRQPIEWEEESDLSDDPFLNAVPADLQSVDKAGHNTLGLALLLLVPLAFLYLRR